MSTAPTGSVAGSHTRYGPKPIIKPAAVKIATANEINAELYELVASKLTSITSG